MSSKKHILNLLSHISEGDYKKANDEVRQIIESKLDERIARISKNKKGK